MKTTVFVCPFAQFGNPGTMAGAQLTADAIREMLADARGESRPCRAHSFRDQVHVKELPLATPEDYAAWRGRARKAARQTLDDGDFLLWVGGNHLSVMPVYEEFAARPGSLVVQFDAHLDVYHYDDTVRELSHGNFIRHLDPRPAIVNLGHRDLFLPPAEIGQYFVEAHAAADAGVLPDRRIRAAKRVFIDIDWDVLDPAYFPAVADALPFGLTPPQLWSAVCQLLASGKVAGLAVSEFDPGRDDRDRSLQLAVWLIEAALLAVCDRGS